MTQAVDAAEPTVPGSEITEPPSEVAPQAALVMKRDRKK